MEQQIEEIICFIYIFGVYRNIDQQRRRDAHSHTNELIRLFMTQVSLFCINSAVGSIRVIIISFIIFIIG